MALAPYAPHICEELWSLTGHEGSVLDQPFPPVETQYLVESTRVYPVAINGKTRAELELPADAGAAEAEQLVLQQEVVLKWLDGKAPKKVIFVKHKMINIVV